MYTQPIDNSKAGRRDRGATHGHRRLINLEKQKGSQEEDRMAVSALDTACRNRRASFSGFSSSFSFRRHQALNSDSPVGSPGGRSPFGSFRASDPRRSRVSLETGQRGETSTHRSMFRKPRMMASSLPEEEQDEALREMIRDIMLDEVVPEVRGAIFDELLPEMRKVMEEVTQTVTAAAQKRLVMVLSAKAKEQEATIDKMAEQISSLLNHAKRSENWF